MIEHLLSQKFQTVEFSIDIGDSFYGIIYPESTTIAILMTWYNYGEKSKDIRMAKNIIKQGE